MKLSESMSKKLAEQSRANNDGILGKHNTAVNVGTVASTNNVQVKPNR
jgi:hypothetical protein